MNQYSDKVGCYIQIPNLGRGQLKYIGPVDGKPGQFAGVDLLANIGKNDGSFQGKRYFDAEYPQSGLFIQVARIAHLLESATDERSIKKKSYGNLVAADDNDTDILMTDSVSSRTQSVRRTSSTGTTVHSVNNGMVSEPYSPTPMRSFRIASRTHVSHDTDTTDAGMGVATTPEAIQSQRMPAANRDEEMMVREYELQLEKQQREILQYKKLLDDQRLVLEEIQPTIDEFERNERRLTSRVRELEEELRTQQEKSERQKQFFEAEHEQLLTVVEQLQVAIEENEKRVLARNGSNEELTKLRAEFDTAKLKWDKERAQLRMHNESLSQEYQSLNKELMALQQDKENMDTEKNMNTEQSMDIEENMDTQKNMDTQNTHTQEHMDTQSTHTQKNQETLTEKNTISESSHMTKSENVSLPVYTPAQRVDPAAGRDLWCYLCEKPGHRTADCPHEPGSF